MTTPIWLLDVDGVLNAVMAGRPEGYKRCRATSDGRSWVILYRPKVIEFISAVHTSGRADVRWLTTWCEDADLRLAPAVGLPQGMKVEGTADHSVQGLGWWKAVTARRISDTEPDRPLIWTDDDLGFAMRHKEVPWLDQRTSSHCAISPNTHEGLSDEDLAAIEDFISRVGDK